MFICTIIFKYASFLILFLSICLSHCYLNHRRLHPYYSTCLRDSSEFHGKIIPVDEEILKKLKERHKDQVYRYLDPLGSQQVQQISDKELEETFGKPLTQKNLAERARRARRINPYRLPDVEPTDKLPYFVNLEFVPESHTDVDTSDPQVLNSQTDKEPDVDNVHFRQGSTDANSNIDNELVSDVSADGTNKDKLEEEDQSDSTFELPPDYACNDPLKPLFDRIEDYPDVKQEYGPKWYLPNLRTELTSVEYEDGWSILPCGKIYKHILQPSLLRGKSKENPTDISSVTFKFRLMEAKSNTKIFDTDDVGGDMVTTYMKDVSPVMKKCLKGMNTGEQAEFIFHISQLNPEHVIIEQLEGVTWIRLWIKLWESHNPNERWWTIGPGDVHLYPSTRETGETKRQKLERETDEITSQIEAELSTNPASPLWEDVLDKMSTSQKESYIKHFDKQLEKVERMKHCEYSGSRGFGEQIKTSGQFGGYDVGHQVGGISKFIAWRETPFMMYVAISVIEGVRAEHVKLDLTSKHLFLSIANNVIIDDDLSGSVDLDTTGIWAMSDAALQHIPLDISDPKLKNPTTNLGRRDEYDSVSRRPCILIFLKKIGTSVRIWGSPFVNV